MIGWMTGIENKILRLATEAKGDWISFDFPVEYYAAAVNLQKQGKIEFDCVHRGRLRIKIVE